MNRSPGNRRALCSKCGSPLYGLSRTSPSSRRLRLGTLDNTARAKAVAHIWTGSKSDWFEITDHLEHFEKEPPTSYCALRKARDSILCPVRKRPFTTSMGAPEVNYPSNASAATE